METKTRTKDVPGHFETIVYQWHSGTKVPAHPTHEVSTWIEPYRTLFEMYTPNSSHKGEASRASRTRPWKNFQHFKSVADNSSTQYPVNYAYDLYEYGSTYSGRYSTPYSCCSGYTGLGSLVQAPFGTTGQFDGGLPSFTAPQTDGGFIPLPSGLDNLITQSSLAMLPGIKASLSLPNFIIEMKDFKNFPAQVKNILKFTLKGGLKKTLKQLLNVPSKGSDAYLQAQFNILPLISDLQKIKSAVDGVEKQLASLLANEGRVIIRHWVYKYDEFAPHVPDVSDYYYAEEFNPLPQWSVFKLHRYVQYEPTVFHAEIQYAYELTDYQREHARVLALQDSLGWTINPAIVWNAIPWSFVVDWVLGVAKWLDQFKRAGMTPRINILNYLWSIKRQRTITCWRGLVPTQNGPPELRVGTLYSLPTVRQTAYRRSVDYHAGVSSILSSGLSPKELSLGAALGGSRLKYRP